MEETSAPTVIGAALTGAGTAIERWEAADDGRVCAGCEFLEGRVWFSAEGPQPPLHSGCRCVRRWVDVDGLHGLALMRVIVAAFRNGRHAESLLAEASERKRQGLSRDAAGVAGSEVAGGQRVHADVRRRRRNVRRRGPQVTGDYVREERGR
jgi:hypothetical protein